MNGQTKSVLDGLAKYLKLAPDSSVQEVLTAADEWFHVPRSHASINEAKKRVSTAESLYESEGTLPEWVHHTYRFIQTTPYRP